jgi:hypothetical protein
MPYLQVVPVIEPQARGCLCVRPYPNHPHGCPNVGHKIGCPPTAPKLEEYFDLAKPCWVIYNVFDFGEHVRRMRNTHPDWTQRQLECCLYWQPRARKELREEVRRFLKEPFGTDFELNYCPEAMGLDVTATLRNVGVELEWPPVEKALQVAFGAIRR